MFHQFLPLVPFTLAGALFFKRKSLAYGLPVLLVLLKMFLTQTSAIYVFLAAALLLAVYMVRTIKASWGMSVWAVAGYASISVILFELIANFGVWFLGGMCVSGDQPLYAHTFSGFVSCFRAAMPYGAAHFLRDVPISVLLVKVLEFAGKLTAVKSVPKEC